MKYVFLALVFLLSGCHTNPVISRHDRGSYKIDTSHAAASHNQRVRFLILHYTALDDAASLDLLTASDTASAHYLVTSVPELDQGKPVVLQLVAEDQRAWHAGVSDWGGRSNLNDTSIGIEIVNPGYTDAADGSRLWYPYGAAQIDLITRLGKDLITRYGIAPENVLAHSDIAPLRKSDPGPLFPWEALAREGVGAWPDAATVQRHLAGREPRAPAPVGNVQAALARYGYKIEVSGVWDTTTRQLIRAFQMHFRPADFSGAADAETEAIAMALLEKYKN